jgi:hypothetical protein
MLALAFFAALWPARAEEDITGDYLRIVAAIQRADSLNTGGRAPAALTNYQAAQVSLRIFKRDHPSWNDKMVSFRLNYLDEKIAALKKPVAPAVPGATNSTPAVKPQPASTASASAAVSAPDTAPAPAPASPPVDPRYLAWSSFKIGASVTTKAVQEMDGKPDYTSERTETLASLDDKQFVLDFTSTTTGSDGAKSPSTGKTTVTKSGMFSAPIGTEPGVTKTEGDEEIEIAGMKIKTHWTLTEATRPNGGSMSLKAWNTPEIPGGLAKSESTFKTVKDTATTVQHQTLVVTAFDPKK